MVIRTHMHTHAHSKLSLDLLSLAPLRNKNWNQTYFRKQIRVANQAARVAWTGGSVGFLCATFNVQFYTKLNGEHSQQNHSCVYILQLSNAQRTDNASNINKWLLNIAFWMRAKHSDLRLTFTTRHRLIPRTILSHSLVALFVSRFRIHFAVPSAMLYVLLVCRRFFIYVV